MPAVSKVDRFLRNKAHKWNRIPKKFNVIILFVNIPGSFVDCLGLATPDDDSEALIYGYGALKFLMMNFNILHFALDNGILQLMALHLKMINLAVSTTCTILSCMTVPSRGKEY